MPRDASVTSGELLNAAIQEDEILNADGDVPRPTNEIWVRILTKLNGRTTTKNIYTRIKGNRDNLLDRIREKKGFSIQLDDANANSYSGTKGEVEVEEDDENSNGSDFFTPGSRDERSVIEPKKTFKVIIPACDFHKMSPIKTHVRRDKIGKLRENYTLPPYLWEDMLADLLWDQHKLPCAFSFKNSRVNKDLSLGREYIKMSAYCTDKKCSSEATGIILQEPIEGEPVTMEWRCKDTVNIKHDSKRFVRGERRLDIGKVLVNSSASMYRHMAANRLMDTSDVQEPPTLYKQHVLRKIRQEQKNLEYTVTQGSDPVMCLEIMKHSQPHCGSIHDIGLDKFFVHYFSTHQLHTYKLLCKYQYVVLMIDATGSLVRKILRTHGPSHHIFLYEGVVHTGKDQIPVVQMLSEKQDANTILYWLNEWQRCGAPTPKEVVTDESRSLQSAVCRSFARCSDRKDYKEKCFNIISGKLSTLPHCFIRIDVAHFLSSAAKWPIWKTDTLGRVKKFYLHCLGLLIQSNNISDFKKTLLNILVVAMSQDEGFDSKNEKIPMEESLYNLTELIRGKSAVGEVISDEVENADIGSPETEIVENDREDSPAEIEGWLDGIKLEASIRAGRKGSRMNPYQSNKLAQKFIEISRDFVFWSAVMVKFYQSPHITASTGAIESDFSNLKRNILKGETKPMHINKFIDVHLQSISGHFKLVSCNISNLEKDNEQNDITTLKDNVLNVTTDVPRISTMETTDESEIVTVDSDTAPHDLNLIENWREKMTSTKRRKSIYLTPFPNMMIVEKRIKFNPPKLLKNGNLCKVIHLSPNQHVTVRNTCPFDALVSVLSNCFLLNENYRRFVDSSTNHTLQAVKSLAINGGSVDTLKLRAKALMAVLKPSVQQNIVIKKKQVTAVEIDSWENLRALANLLLIDVPSAIVTTNCTSDCKRQPQEQHVVLDTDCGVVGQTGLKYLEKAIARCLKIVYNEKITEITSEVQLPKCTVPCTGSPVLNVQGMNHLLIDVDYFDYSDEPRSSTFPFNRMCSLDEIPSVLKFGDKMYSLGGVVCFRPGHYTAYNKKMNFWKLHDGLKSDIIENISGKEKVCPHMLIYV